MLAQDVQPQMLFGFPSNTPIGIDDYEYVAIEDVRPVDAQGLLEIKGWGYFAFDQQWEQFAIRVYNDHNFYINARSYDHIGTVECTTEEVTYKTPPPFKSKAAPTPKLVWRMIGNTKFLTQTLEIQQGDEPYGL